MFVIGAILTEWNYFESKSAILFVYMFSVFAYDEKFYNTDCDTITKQNKIFHSFRMDLGVYNWQACRSFGKCDYLISLLIFTCTYIAQNGQASEQGKPPQKL